MRALRALLLLVATAAVHPALANYRFRVPVMQSKVVVEKDGGIDLTYRILFQNTGMGQPIDIVDVGLPHADYDIGTMHAALYLPVDGGPGLATLVKDLEGGVYEMYRHPLTTIRPSTYIDIGVEVPIPSPLHIPPGGYGVFEFEARMPNMVYSDTTDETMASMQFTPTWFDPAAVVGPTRLQLAIVLPEGVSPDQVRYHDVPYQSLGSSGDRTVAYWEWQTSLTGPHLVGISFPRTAVSHVIEVTKWQLLGMWWEKRTDVRGLVGLAMLLLFSIFYFRFTGMTGCVVWGLFLGGFTLWWMKSPTAHLYAVFAWPFLLGLMEWTLRRRREHYLPPILHVEGGGIKRGLTAPEAAVVLERPLNDVLALVILGLLKKGLVRRTGPGLLDLRIDPDVDAPTREERLARAAAAGKVIHDYEQPFLKAIRDAKGGDLLASDFKDALTALIESAVKRMEGFDLNETRAYYRHIVSRAWTEAKSLGQLPPERREAVLDRNLGWLLLDGDWQEQWDSHSTLKGYHPSWWYMSTPGHGSSVPTGGSAPTSPLGGHTPRGSDVAASFAGWFENQAGGLADALGPSAAVVSSGKSGVIDLSGVDTVTGEVFSAMASGSGGGGGGCACAGCACACACAGGGR